MNLMNGRRVPCFRGLIMASAGTLLVFSFRPTMAPAAEPLVIDLWPAAAPGAVVTLPPETATIGFQDRLIAGKPVTRVASVAVPQAHIYRPTAEIDTGAAVVICPGGGHSILAWDLEGTEVAGWLTSCGVTGIVLKYRVPGRPKNQRWLAAVQDAQRAIRIVRSRAAEWQIDPDRVGICGFSAGGEVATRTALSVDATYEAMDDADGHSCRANFAILVYPAYLVEKGVEGFRLKPDIKVMSDAPEMFLVHAADDGQTPLSSLLLAVALEGAGVPVELHLYPTGGHGYGLRATSAPVTGWSERAGAWLRERGWLRRPVPPSVQP